MSDTTESVVASPYMDLITVAVEASGRSITPSGIRVMDGFCEGYYQHLAGQEVPGQLEFVEGLHEELKNFVLSKVQEQGLDETADPATMATIIIDACLQYICGTVLGDVCSHWELIAAFKADPSFSESYATDDGLYAISVITETETFVHTMGHETAYGLQLALTLTDKPTYALSFDGQEAEEITKPMYAEQPRYSCFINGERVEFADLDFLTGLRTGCDWIDINYTAHVSELMEGTTELKIE